MTQQEEKQLFLKDLSARLFYGVKFQGEDSKVYTLDAANYFALQVEDVIFKPYLRPISSMTEEETKEYSKLWDLQDEFPTDADIRFKIDVFDWLNAHHFDFRNLIEKGLALEAPEGMYDN